MSLENVISVETEKGSVYTYNEDGTTQRFKKVESKFYNPKTALVFIPDYNTLKRTNPSSNFEQVYGETASDFNQIILEYIHHHGKTTHIINAEGVKLDTNKQIANEKGPVYLAFSSKDKVDFYFPVSHEPKLGYNTFDTRKFFDYEKNSWMRENHIGNKVVKINRK